MALIAILAITCVCLCVYFSLRKFPDVDCTTPAADMPPIHWPIFGVTKEAEQKYRERSCMSIWRHDNWWIQRVCGEEEERRDKAEWCDFLRGREVFDEEDEDV